MTDRSSPLSRFAGSRIVLVSLVAAVGGSACTAILAPDDDVIRCATVDDCPDPEDPRAAVECRWDEGADLDPTKVDKICVAAPRQTGCDPTGYSPQNGEEHPFQVAMDMYNSAARYGTSCDQTMPAKRGCPSVGGMGCEGTLVENYLGYCDVEEEPANPAYSLAASAPEFDMYLNGQDIADAFCQSFYCDASVVCNRDNQQCEACDPDALVGKGGCGTVFLGGEPSCIYPGEMLECGDGNTDVNNPRFGNCG